MAPRTSRESSPEKAEEQACSSAAAKCESEFFGEANKIGVARAIVCCEWRRERTKPASFVCPT